MFFPEGKFQALAISNHTFFAFSRFLEWDFHDRVALSSTMVWAGITLIILFLNIMHISEKKLTTQHTYVGRSQGTHSIILLLEHFLSTVSVGMSNIITTCTLALSLSISLTLSIRKWVLCQAAQIYKLNIRMSQPRACVRACANACVYNNLQRHRVTTTNETSPRINKSQGLLPLCG